MTIRSPHGAQPSSHIACLLIFLLDNLHTYLPSYLPTYLLTYLPTYLPTSYPTYQPTYLPIGTLYDTTAGVPSSVGVHLRDYFHNSLQSGGYSLEIALLGVAGV